MSFSCRTQLAVEPLDVIDIMALGSRLGRLVPAVWFDSNAVKMTTVEHDLRKFSKLAFSFSQFILHV